MVKAPRSGSPHAHGRSDVWERPNFQARIRVIQKRFGARVRSLRLKAGLGQEDAAERIGLHAKHLQRLENGKANPTLATMAAISEAFSISIGALIQSD